MSLNNLISEVWWTRNNSYS